MARARVPENSTQYVVPAGAALVLVLLAYRAWMLWGSYFFTDDYRLMLDAHDQPLTWQYLVAPFDDHVMPLSRLVIWCVTQAGTLNWALGASVVVAMYLAAGLACLWMLVTAFGERWFVMVPLTVYLSTAITVPAFMWWCAALNQVPLQASFFLATTFWLRYLRRRRWRDLLLTAVVVVVALGFYEKSLLLLPALLYLALAFFTVGTHRDRLRTAVRRYWPGLLVGMATGCAYLLVYLSRVPAPVEDNTRELSVALDNARDVASSMLGTTFPTGALGGPWQWWDTSPPVVLAGPSPLMVHVAWVVLAAVVAYSLLRRERTGRVWLFLAGWLVADWAILAISRGQLYGGLTGLEYRYLTDSAGPLVLALGLAFCELRGAPGSTRQRPDPYLRIGAPPALVAAVTALVAAGGIWSSWQYVQFWHHDNAGAIYVPTLRSDLDRSPDPVDLPEQLMPATVMPAYSAPDNLTSVFTPLISANAQFPDHSAALHIVDTTGAVTPAVIGPGPRSLAGPSEGCGWRITAGSKSIPLDQEADPEAPEPTGPDPADPAAPIAAGTTNWARIGYLASSTTPVTVTAGGDAVEATLRKGLHSLYVELPGGYRSVTIGGLGPDVTVCVDTVEVGRPIPEEAS